MTTTALILLGVGAALIYGAVFDVNPLEEASIAIRGKAPKPKTPKGFDFKSVSGSGGKFVLQ